MLEKLFFSNENKNQCTVIDMIVIVSAFRGKKPNAFIKKNNRLCLFYLKL